MIPVKPTTTYPTLTWIDYKVTDLVLKTSITFAIEYYNDLAILIDRRTVHIVNEEYFAWGNDDDYIPAIIFNKLGLDYNIATPLGVLVNINNKYFNKIFGVPTSFSASNTLDINETTESLLKVIPILDVTIEGVNGWEVFDLLNNPIPEFHPLSIGSDVFIKKVGTTEYYKVKITFHLMLYKVSFEVLEIL